MKKYRIAVLPGDGIGPEVVTEAVGVLEAAAQRFRFALTIREGLIGGVAIDREGVPFPESTYRLVRSSQAVLLGAVGGPKWDDLDVSVRPERGLLAIRQRLGLFANLRPARLFGWLVEDSTLKREVVEGTDLLVVRELTGGIYFGRPRGIRPHRTGEKGINTEVYTTAEIERVARVAFEVARRRRRRVCSVDKANVLESSQLWRRVVTKVHGDYPDVELSHMYVDNCAMQLIRDPRQFDVILTTNLFGDILSDEAAQLTGSIGMLPSASLGGLAMGRAGSIRRGLYEPVHGSAPDIAGTDRANPIATILSMAMMLRYSFGLEEAAAAVERAVEEVLEQGYRTPDLLKQGGRPVGTREMGALIRQALGG